MKNSKINFFGLIAMTVVMAFAYSACDDLSSVTGNVLTGNVSINNTSPKVDDTITAVYNPGNGTGIPAWQWVSGDEVVSGANSNVYKVRAQDLGRVLTVHVSYADQIGSLSASTGVVAPADEDDIPVPIVNAEIIVIAPVNGAVPNVSASGTGNFTVGEVVWSPSHNPFQVNTEYTAVVTLMANSGFTFIGLASATVNGQDATVSNSTETSVTLSYKFPVTIEATVTSIAIKTQPNQLTYTHGDPLDLSGLMVTLTYSDGFVEDVPAAGFAGKNITASPAEGNHLVRSTHNGQPVRITYGGLPQLSTGALTVNPKVISFTIDPILAQTFTGSVLTPAVIVRDGEAILAFNTDYTVSFSNNVNVGTNAAVTVTGIGNYAGSFGSAVFSINQALITNVEILVMAPVMGATPATTAYGTGNFSIGAVSWSPSHIPFRDGTQYTATVVLTADSGYTFSELDTATVNVQNAEVSNNIGTAVMLSFTFPATEDRSVNRFQANSYTGNDRIRYSFSYDEYDFYYIYLGSMANIPIFHFDGFEHDGMSADTYTVTMSQQRMDRRGEEIANNSQTAIGQVRERTISETTGENLSVEVSIKANILDMISTQTKVKAEESWSEYISYVEGNSSLLTTSLTNTVSHVTEFTEGTQLSHGFNLANRRAGFYRYTLFAVSDVYLHILKDNSTGEWYYEFKEHITPLPPVWSLDFSEDPSFNRNNDTNFELDISILDELPKPTIGLNHLRVTNANEWNDALNFIRNDDFHTYFITVDGNVSIPGTYDNSFGNRSGITVIIYAINNGKLSLNGQGSILRIGGNQILNIQGPDMVGMDNNDAPVLFIGDNGNATMAEGSIRGNGLIDIIGSRNGAGVFIGSSGNFTMQGSAVIYGNTATGSGAVAGGGVYVNGGNFTMKENSTVHSNTVASSIRQSSGGGVFISTGNFIMQDNSSVYGNTAELGGGVCVQSPITSSAITIMNMKDGSSIHSNTNGGVSYSGSYNHQDDFFYIQGNSSIYDNTGTGVVISRCNFIMQGNSSIYGNYGGIHVGLRVNIIMQDNSEIYGNGDTTGVRFDTRNSRDSSFTMKDNASVHSGMGIGVNISSAIFNMYNNASVHNNIDRGIFLRTDSSLTMHDDTSVYNNGRGGISSNSFDTSIIMQDNASVYGNITNVSNSGGGVSVNNGSFAMRGNASVHGNSINVSDNGVGSGGVYINNGSFTMQGGVIHGINAVPSDLANTVVGGVYNHNLTAALYVTGSESEVIYGDGAVIVGTGSGLDNTVIGRQ